MSERLMDGIVELSERPLRGMITLRGDLSRAGLRKAVETGVPMPERGRITQSGARAAAWMSLDELLLMSPHDQVSSDVRVLRAALQDSHHLVQDVSDARAVFRLEGPDGREVLSKLCPVDLRPEAFGPGRFRRTRIAQVPCAFWMESETRIELIAFRSVADYVWGVLSHANNSNARLSAGG